MANEQIASVLRLKRVGEGEQPSTVYAELLQEQGGGNRQLLELMRQDQEQALGFAFDRLPAANGEQTWTIIGFYSDSGETCSEVVQAADPKGAAEEAYRLAKESGGDDFRLISVIAGDHPEALGLPEPMDAAEFELWKKEEE